MSELGAAWINSSIVYGDKMQDIDGMQHAFEEMIKSKKEYDLKKYRDTILGIVDILGFSQFIQTEKDNAPKKIIEIINDSIFINKFALPENIQYKMLSDTFIVYSDVITAKNVYYVICALENFRVRLLENGFLCRGALVKNKNYIHNDVIISEALVDAHKIESSVAKYPRIIVDMSVIDIIKPQIVSGNILNEAEHLIKNRVIKDFDNEYIITPFVGLPDIAAYLYEDFRYFACRDDPENQQLFIVAMTKFRNGLNSCKQRISTRACANKINYFINTYNKTLKEASVLLKANISELYLENV